MKKNRFSPLFSLGFLAFALFQGAFLLPASAIAQQVEENDLRSAIQETLPSGEEITDFLRISPQKAWITTLYTPENSLTPLACSLSFVTMSGDSSGASGALNTSFTLLTTKQGGKIRVFNQEWTLPEKAEGQMTLRGQSLFQRFSMTARTPTLVESRITEGNAGHLLFSLAKGSEIWLSFSEGQPQSVPSLRTIPLLNAFKTCSQTYHFANLGGPLDPNMLRNDNPF